MVQGKATCMFVVRCKSSSLGLYPNPVHSTNWLRIFFLLLPLLLLKTTRGGGGFKVFFWDGQN